MMVGPTPLDLSPGSTSHSTTLALTLTDSTTHQPQDSYTARYHSPTTTQPRLPMPSDSSTILLLTQLPLPSLTPHLQPKSSTAAPSPFGFWPFPQCAAVPIPRLQPEMTPLPKTFLHPAITLPTMNPIPSTLHHLRCDHPLLCTFIPRSLPTDPA
jgi:hypothetical protein